MSTMPEATTSSADKQKALTAKDQGNDAYRKKDFETAHKHYDEAIALDPTNVTFLNNKAAVLLEEAKYDECIELCQKAVEIGREQQADFKLIAKAFARTGNAYLKKGDKAQALLFFDKSVSEYRDPELMKKRAKVAAELKQEEKKAYIDPEIAQREKAKGNEFFKRGNYPDAMKHYKEAIARDPENGILYSNRAACYQKLMEFQRALEDSEMCIKLAPDFIKGYLRKGAALIGLQEYTRAQMAYDTALQLEPYNEEARAGSEAASAQNTGDPEERRRQALQDPEVQQILGDPVMRMILEQMSNDPASIKEHLKNPDIRTKLLRLREAGIVQMR